MIWHSSHTPRMSPPLSSAMPKILKLRELIKKLKNHDSRFIFLSEKRGKGSERIIYHPDIGGSEASFPIKCHGRGTEIDKAYYPLIRSRFRLPRDFFK